MKWFSRFFKGPSHICYVDGGDGDTGGSGGGGVGFQVNDDDGDTGVTPDDGGSPTGDTGGAGGDLDAGGDDKGDGKKPRLYTDEDVSRMVQQRLAGDKSRKIVERLSKKTGLSVEELEKRFDALEEQNRENQLNEAAKRSGIDPKLLMVIANQHRELQNLKLNQQLNEMRSNTKDFPGFAEIEGKVIDKANELNIPLSDAYWVVAGRERVMQAAREAEHRAANNRQKLAGKDRVQGDAASEMGVAEAPKIPDDVKRMAKLAGMDPEEYYDSMMSENIEQYRERKAKREARRNKQ